MEIVFRLIGDPDELTDFNMTAWFANQVPDTLPPLSGPQLPQSVKDYLDRAPRQDSTHKFVHTFLTSVLADRHTEFDFGKSQGAQRGESPYVQLRHIGKQRVGAYARVRPRGYVIFRLPPSEAGGYTHAQAADLSTTENPYGVRITLDSAGAVAEAMDLAAKARRAAEGQ